MPQPFPGRQALISGTDRLAVLILVDEAASAIIGGVPQLDRLLRNAREAWPGAEVTLLERGAGREREKGETDALVSAPWVLLLRTNLVVGRGVLPRLAAAAARGEEVPARLLSGAALAPDGTLGWDHLAGLLPRVPAEPTEATGFYAVLGDSVAPREAERRLVASLGKPSDGYVARYLNRPVSTRLTRLLAATSVTPDLVSMVVLGLALGAAAGVAQGTSTGFLLGFFLNQAASMIDGTDGELARLKFLETRRGAWLDTSIDLFGNHLLIAALGLGLSRQAGLTPALSSSYLLEGILTTIGSALCVWLIARHTRRTSGEAHFNNFNAPMVQGAAEGGLLRRAFAAVLPLFRRDFYALFFLGLAVAGKPAWVLHLLAAGVLAHFPAIIWVWWKHQPVAALAGPGQGAPGNV